VVRDQVQRDPVEDRTFVGRERLDGLADRRRTARNERFGCTVQCCDEQVAAARVRAADDRLPPDRRQIVRFLPSLRG
jgi:hypothetical protein